MISPAQLLALVGHCDAEVIAPALSAAAADAEISTPRRLAHWLGQLAVESAGFNRMTENLNYSAERLCAVWPGRFPTTLAAQPFAHNPDALANRVYGGRLGNTEPGDGARYKGRGFIQITGRANYAKFGELTGLDLVTHPDLAIMPDAAARIAAAFWTAHGLNAMADADNIEGITRAINGGQNGLADRKEAVADAKVIFGIRSA